MNAFQEYFVETLTMRYADFNGRARRSEYWFFALFQTLIVVALCIILGIIGYKTEGDSIIFFIIIGILVLFILATIIPNLALIVRRLHDTNKTGWLLLLYFIPIGGLVLFIFTLLDSDPNRNQYGPNPKADALTSAEDHLIEY